MTSQRTLLTPLSTGEFSLSDDSSGGPVFWKEILKEGTIDYNGQKITFDHNYLQDLANSFKAGAYDQTAFLLANKDNEHTMDPERFRGEVTAMQVGGPDGEPGLWGKIKFRDQAAASAVISNPKLGVSARIKEAIHRADGKTFPRAIVHVLGTLDPRVTGMSPWRMVELSETDDDTVVLDMTSTNFSKGTSVAKAKLSEMSPETDFSKFTDEELESLIAEMALDDLEDDEPDDDDEDDSDEDDSDEDEEDNEADEHSASSNNSKELEGASLSNDVKAQLDLANSNVAEALRRADEALARAAAAEWKEERSRLIASGVPPFEVDLCEPILNRPDAMVIDLSNTGKPNLDVSKVVRALLAERSGTIDMSVETGHGGLGSDADGDEAILAQWKAESGI